MYVHGSPARHGEMLIVCGCHDVQYLNKPAWDPLIPDPLPEPHYRPYTLVIDLDDMLIHSSWDVSWIHFLRPRFYRH